VSRETENALLLLAGLSTGMVAVTGAYTRYVRPALLPWLLLAAALLITLAATAIVRDLRRAPDERQHGHRHRSQVVWLLVVPVVVLIFIVPPALGPRAAGTTAIEVSTEVLRRPFPPLPPEPAPAVSLREVLTRVAEDSAGTLDDRLITVTGFTLRTADHVDLARIIITCCAADARLARMRLGGPAAEATNVPDNTWVSVQGKVVRGQGNTAGSPVATLLATRVVRIDPPADPYGH
jgi:uncharacterized repeat protein (TIGR03943 family)